MSRYTDKPVIILTLILLFYPGTNTFPGHEINISYSGYTDNNGVSVFTPIISGTLGLGPFTSVTFTGTEDAITAASRTKPVVDGISSATPSTITTAKVERRHDYLVSFLHKIKETTLNLSGDYSKESDYQSTSYFISVTQELNDRNTALSFGYSNFRDKILPFGVPWTDTKSSQVYDLSLTQVLAPCSQARITFSYGLDDGYLSNPYHRVLISNFYFKERHPTVRDKLAIGLFYTYLLAKDKESTRTSWQLDYRYYYDNWDIKSHTLGVKYNRYLTETVRIFLRGRFYTQTAAGFFKNIYPTEERFITSDIKLAAFNSYLYGLGGVYTLNPSLSIEGSYELYTQVGNLNYDLYKLRGLETDLLANIFHLSLTYKY